MENHNVSVVHLLVRAHGPYHLKLEWITPNGCYPPYLVDKGMVTRASEAVRLQLAELVLVARRDKARYAEILRQLARTGAHLFETLFAHVEGYDAGRVEAYLRRDRTSCISVSVDDRIHVPWGLIFEGQVQCTSVDVDEYTSFWCLGRNVAAVYFRVPPSEPGELAPPGLLTVANVAALRQAEEHLSEAERLRWRTVQGLGELLTSADELLSRWLVEGSRIGLLYFFCQADGCQLRFERDYLTTDTIALKLKSREPRRQPCLVFLNGCLTAVGTESGGFIEAVGVAGFGGLIGTETWVPDTFALMFGCDLLAEALTSRRPLIEVLRQLREKHWPLSLLYANYVYPSVMFDPLNVTIASDRANYALGIVGDNDL